MCRPSVRKMSSAGTREKVSDVLARRNCWWSRYTDHMVLHFPPLPLLTLGFLQPPHPRPLRRMVRATHRMRWPPWRTARPPAGPGAWVGGWPHQLPSPPFVFRTFHLAPVSGGELSQLGWLTSRDTSSRGNVLHNQHQRWLGSKAHRVIPRDRRSLGVSLLKVLQGRPTLGCKLVEKDKKRYGYARQMTRPPRAPLEGQLKPCCGLPTPIPYWMCGAMAGARPGGVRGRFAPSGQGEEVTHSSPVPTGPQW